VELPLFPVGDLVLLPGVVLDLHVFEPRYRELIGRVRASGEPFAIPRVTVRGAPLGPASTRALEPTLARVGTLAHLTEVAYFPDGSADIKVVGGERYRVLGVEHERFAYMVAEAEPWPLEPADPAWVAALAREAVTRFLSMVSPRLGDVRAMVPEDPLLAASFVAANLRLPGDDAQRVLEAPSLLERFEQLLEHLAAPSRALN
jgi:Lon protease-like protein